MPWRGPRYEGEFPSLGWELARLIEDYMVAPSGLHYGKPLRLTDRQLAFLVRMHRIDPKSGRYVYRKAVKEGPKGDGKSPFAAALAFAHLVGPVVFDGWDADGQPVGRPHPTPWIQIAALAEDQTDNCYMQLRASLGESAALEEFGIDLGLTRIYTKGANGKIEPVTSVGGTREGQPITFAVKEETQYWTSGRGGDRLDRTLARNLAKTGGLSISVTNSYREGEDSVAESDADAAGKQAAGLLYEGIRAPYVADLTDTELVLRSLDIAYDPEATWVDKTRLAEECADETIPPGERRRFYFNIPDMFADESWLPEGTWEGARRKGRSVNTDRPFAMAVDMALRHDTCAIRWGQFQSDGRIAVEATEFVPGGDMLDIDAIESFIVKMQATGNLVECAYDPAYFERSAQALAERGVCMVEFPQSNALMAPACGTAYELIVGGQVVHDDDERSTQQVLNGVAFPAGEGWRLKKSKVTKGKIDSAIALVILLARLVNLDQLAAEPEPFAFLR